jgi:large subunit ribosomal protein L29
MKNTEIKGLTLAELNEKVLSERENLRKLKFAHQISSVENPMRIKESRRLIARLKTEVTSKEVKK